MHPDEDTNESNQENKELIKKKRKWEKKLCEIEKLERKRETGEQLTLQEEEKISKKGEFKTELAKLLDGVSL